MPSPLTIQPSNMDNWIYEGGVNTNYGTPTFFYIGADDATKAITALLQFDFSALPDGAVISEATLSVYYYLLFHNPITGRTYWAYELTQTGWTETKSTWNAAYDDDLDGVNDSGDIFWATAGAKHDPNDFTTTNGAYTTVGAALNWLSWNVLALVQHFNSSHNKIANFLIKDSALSTGCAAKIYSNNYTTDPSLCPKLIITYTPPDAAVWLRRITINRDKSPRIWKRKEI